MKFLVIIVGLLVSPEILCKDANNNITELKPSSQDEWKRTGSQILESIPEDKSKMLPDSYLSNQDMRKRATDKYTEICENAASALKKIQTKVENLNQEATKEKDIAIQKCSKQYRRAESILVLIEASVLEKFKEAQKSATDEYNQALAASDEKLEKSAEARDIAYKAAEIEFEKVRQKIEENKQKVENENQEVLEKAQIERKMALEAAKTNKEKAEEIYAKAMQADKVMTPDEEEKLRDELQEEIDKYEEAVEMADDKWQKVLDTFGIGKEIEAALDKALTELEEARQKADLILKEIEDEENKVINELRQKKLQAESLANAESARADDQINESQIRNDFQFDICRQKARRQWRKMLKPANEELKKATREFNDVKNTAENELRQTLEKAKLAEANKTKDITPRKKIGVRNLNPSNRRRPRRKISECDSEK